MTELGYQRFAVSGGDIGSATAEALALRHPDRIVGVHLTDVPFWHLFTLDPGELSPAERDFLVAGQDWARREGAYQLMQSTKPTTPAVGAGRLAGRAGRLDRGEAARVERRVRRLHPGRGAHPRHALLGHQHDRLVVRPVRGAADRGPGLRPGRGADRGLDVPG